MNIRMDINGNLQAMMAAEIEAGERAVSKAIGEAARKELTDLGWKLGSDNDQLGFAYALEKGMVLTRESKSEWVPQLTRISKENIVPWWANRAGSRAKPAFNEFLAPIVGYQLS